MKKIKTSISIDRRVLAAVKKEAERADRSVSYVIEKFIEERMKEVPEAKPAQYPRREVNYRAPAKKRSSG